MPEFKFKAMLKDGKMIRGKMLANSKHQIVNKLKDSKVQPVSIKKIKMQNNKKVNKDRKLNSQKASISTIKDKRVLKKKLSFKEMLSADFHLFNRVTTKDIISFSNNFYILKKANFNNVQALESLYQGVENPALKDVVEDLLIGVQEGEKISTLMENYPKVFSNMYVSFVKVGESSGSLDKALLYAREYLEKSTRLTKSIRSVIIPRVLQFLGIMIMLFGCVILGVPVIQNVYTIFESKDTIPPATQFAFNMANWLSANWYYPVAIILIIALLIVVYINTLKGRYQWDRFVIKFPVVGALVKSIIVSRFFQAMLLNLKNGMRIQESLDIAKEVTSNYYFLSVAEIAKANSLIGESWIKPFEDNGLFQPMVLEMISIGMKTDLAEMMEKVTEYLDIEIKESIDKFTKWLPEVSYIFIGIALIVFTIVVMIPLIDVYMGSFLMPDM